MHACELMYFIVQNLLPFFGSPGRRNFCCRPPQRVCATIEEPVEAGTPRNFASSRLFIPHQSNNSMERGQSTDIVTNPALCRFGFSLVAAKKLSDLGSIHHQSMARCHQRHFGSPQTTPWCYRAAIDALQTYSLCAFVTQQQCRLRGI